ncbi:PAAR domain-containing protein [Capnocytophaga cynodegmi]|uniref:PAAR domain-containing protein n=1 Tax=Capnocytophaga cynodegmi TaxID=28189 RepID=UPI00385C7A51
MPGQAATLGSMHTCPMTTGTVPHVGGPVSKGASSVLIGGKPATTMGEICTCAAGGPDVIVQGISTVLIEGKPAATVGDMTAHGGVIVSGEATVLIGTGGSSPTRVDAIEALAFTEINSEEKEEINDLPFFDLNI